MSVVVAVLVVVVVVVVLISTRSMRSGRIIRRRRLSSTRGRIIHMRTILSGGCSCYITHCYHILSTSMIL